MAKKSEVQKLAGWWKGNKELVDPPEREERGDILKHAEVADVRDEPEEQYNIRIRRSLKKRLKRLVVGGRKADGRHFRKDARALPAAPRPASRAR